MQRDVRSRFRGVFIATILGFTTSVLGAVDLPLAEIGDDADFRASLKAGVFSMPPSRALAYRTTRSTLSDGSRVEVRVERGNGEFMIIVAREGDGTFPVWAQGGWALYRRVADGENTRIRYFPRSDPHCYLQFRPDGKGRSLMDAVAYGAYLTRSAVLPFSFDRLLVESIPKILARAGNAFPRRYFEPDPGRYADMRTLTGAVRARLGGLTYADDGALDRAGMPVLIETGAPQAPGIVGLNCSGFAKWLADGLLRPLGFPRLDLDALKIPPVPRGNSFSEPFDSILDPYFGLDWTRNLAAAVGRAYRGARGADPHEYEVREIPIASLRIPGGDGSSSISFPAYLEDTGFRVDALPAILYALAVSEPGRLYLGSVNRDAPDDLQLRMHFHVAAFLPQFDEAGRFSVPVFESAAETSLEAFVARYPDESIHLVRLYTEGSFTP